MDLVFEFGDRSAMIMIPNGADELRDRTVRRILHVRVQCGDVDHRIGDDGERLHAKMLVLVVTCSLRNQVWNDRQQNLQTLLDRLHRSWKIHDQGPSMESCEATTDCRHRIRLHSVCSQRLRHSWQFQLEELFRRLWRDISRRDTSSAGRDDHVGDCSVSDFISNGLYIIGYHNLLHDVGTDVREALGDQGTTDVFIGTGGGTIRDRDDRDVETFILLHWSTSRIDHPTS